MVDLASVGGLVAAGHDALPVSEQDEVDQLLGWCVSGTSVVQGVPADGVGENPAPHTGGSQHARRVGIDRAVAVEVGRVLVQADPGGQRDGDIHGDRPAVRVGQRRSGGGAAFGAAVTAEGAGEQRRPRQPGQRVRAGLIQRPPAPGTITAAVAAAVAAVAVAVVAAVAVAVVVAVAVGVVSAVGAASAVAALARGVSVVAAVALVPTLVVPALVGCALVVLAAQRVRAGGEGGHDRLGVFRGQVGIQPGHTVLGRLGPHPPVSTRFAALLLRFLRVQLVQKPVDHLRQLH